MKSTNLKDIAMVGGAAFALLGLVGATLGLPIIWMGVLAVLAMDLATILFLGSLGGPPDASDRLTPQPIEA